MVRFESDGSEVDGSEVEAQRQGKRSQDLSIMKMNRATSSHLLPHFNPLPRSLLRPRPPW